MAGAGLGCGGGGLAAFGRTFRISSDFLAASRKDSEMTVGWMPFSSRICAWFSSDPAMTVTVVVPSPASTSCDFDRSTSILAVG